MLKRLKETCSILPAEQEEVVSSHHHNPDYYYSERLLRAEALISSQQGVLIHGAALAIDNKAVLFLGKSGAGKSTVLRRLAAKGTVIHEDKLLLHKKNSQWFVYAAPWDEKGSEIPYLGTKNLVVPVDKCLFVHKELKQESYLQQVYGRDEIWQFLLRECGHPVLNNKLYDKFMNVVDSLSQELNFFDLYHNLSTDADQLFRIIR